MAKVNKKSFHCIPLAVFAHNSHSTLSSKVWKVEDRWNPLCWFQALCPDTDLADLSQTGDQRSVVCYFLSCSTSFLLFYFFALFLFPSDVPGGFSVNQLEEAREGGDLHLTCSANKYLYAELSWQRVNNTRESLTTEFNSLQPSVGEFSTSLVLLLNNLTAADSGAYRCSARHIITGQETHLDTQVVVTSK